MRQTELHLTPADRAVVDEIRSKGGRPTAQGEPGASCQLACAMAAPKSSE